MTEKLPFLFLLLFLTVLLALVSLATGSSSLSLYTILFGQDTILLQLRLARTLSAFVDGGLLAFAGALMQLLLHNPLADPYVMGVSSGAALSLLFMMFLGMPEDNLMLGAWIGSLSTIFLIYLIARTHRFESHTLLLAGIALACGFSAAISLVLFITPANHLHSMLFWLTGDLNGSGIPWVSGSVLVGALCLGAILAPGLNIFIRGETEAKALGLSCERLRLILFLLSSLCTAAAVTLGGCIGFIGLIIPHLVRRVIGTDYRMVLPFSVFAGGALLMLADTLARTALSPQQIPVGILITLLGVPIFIVLLQK